jgi:ubiquinone/menaquinone biosynthesis C-methylase UbiE
MANLPEREVHEPVWDERTVQDRLRVFWDEDAKTYDRSPTHAATDPVEAAAWRAALARHLPSAPAEVLDAGAGTGAMSLLLADLGYRVTALDLSSEMLDRAREKASTRGLELHTVVGAATEPPRGPFDAVVERHLLWTTPDPVAALSAWRRAAPKGRLLLFEGIWRRDGPAARVRGWASDVLRTALAVPHDHHSSYDPQLMASLPLAGAPSPVPLLQAVATAGWRRVRIERLRDVEWARRLALPATLGWLETRPQFAVIADA